MTSAQWIEVATKLAWPLLGFFTLIYVWRSDAINKLIKISEAVKQLREQLKELVEAEEQLRQSVGAVAEMTALTIQLQSDVQLMKADIENIRDRVDTPHEMVPDSSANSKTSDNELGNWFSQIDEAWQNLSETLQTKLGYYDWRMTGSEAYRFAHGNRKGTKLSYEQADEVARLHSSIKSYRRRQSSLSEWLTKETMNEFVNACKDIEEQIRAL